MQNEGKIKLSRAELIQHLKKLDDAKCKKETIIQQDIHLNKLQVKNASDIMEVYRKRLLDGIFFSTGVEEEDLIEAAIYYRLPEKLTYFFKDVYQFQANRTVQN